MGIQIHSGINTSSSSSFSGWCTDHSCCTVNYDICATFHIKIEHICSGKTDPDEKWGQGVNLFIMEMDDDVIDIINLYANYY